MSKAKKDKNALNVIGTILKIAPKYKKRIYWASAYSVLNKILDLAPPLLIGLAVDMVVNKEVSFISRTGISSISGQLVFLSLLTFVIWALESWYEYLFQVAWRNLAQDIQHELRLKAFGNVLDLDMNFFENSSSGELLAILNDDVNQLERFLDNGANEILQVMTTVVVIGGIFIYLAPTIAFYSVFPIPVILWSSFWFQAKLAPRYAQVRAKAGNISADLNNVLGGIAIVKSYVTENVEYEKASDLSKNYSQANYQAILLSSAFSPLIRMVIVLGFTVTLVLGGLMAIDGTLAVGSYSVMVFLIQRLLWPLTRLGQTFDLYQRAGSSISRIIKLIETPKSIVENHHRIPDNEFRSDINFLNINFKYDPEYSQNVLSNLSLTIVANTTIGIVGSTGSGKSSLIKLLLRFYEYQEGQILIGKYPIESISLKQLRESIALVSQDTYLFHGTVWDNITYGNKAADKDEILKICQMADVEEFVHRLPNGYQTIVGERGQKLSGGQRQRISLARALLKNSPILILDEATSSVDNETEFAIQKSLDKYKGTKTIIVIAHRLSTVRNADTIFVLERGQILESGLHDKLISTDKGIYSKLWAIQTGIVTNH